MLRPYKYDLCKMTDRNAKEAECFVMRQTANALT